MAISKFFIAVALLAIPLLTSADLIEQSTGFRTELNRVSNSPISTRIRSSHLRASYLASRSNRSGSGAAAAAAATDDDLTSIGDAFTLPLFIGTPAQRIDVVFDTGSDLVWVDCDGTHQTRYNYTQSSTFQFLSCVDAECAYFTDYCSGSHYCMYDYAYGGGSDTIGLAAADSVHLFSSSGRNQTTFPSIAIGCGFTSDGFQNMHGVSGFGRGPISLTSQLSRSIPNRFSYCLSSSGQSPFFYGGAAHVQSSNSQTIPLLPSVTASSFYFVNLTSISVAGNSIPMPDSQNGGTILDSGTTLSFLPPRMYTALRNSFSSRISLPIVNGSSIGFDLCYNISSYREYYFPQLTLHFNDAISVSLHQSNFMLVPSRAEVEDWDESVACLALASSRGYGINIIGNVMQQDHHIMFDNARSTVTIATAQCSDL